MWAGNQFKWEAQKGQGSSCVPARQLLGSANPPPRPQARPHWSRWWRKSLLPHWLLMPSRFNHEKGKMERPSALPLKWGFGNSEKLQVWALPYTPMSVDNYPSIAKKKCHSVLLREQPVNQEKTKLLLLPRSLHHRLLVNSCHSNDAPRREIKSYLGNFQLPSKEITNETQLCHQSLFFKDQNWQVSLLHNNRPQCFFQV